jgi:hypothetical protein
LRKMLNKTHEVVNLAVDQMSTFDLEKRSPERNPWKRYQIGRTRSFHSIDTKMDVQYPVSEDGCIYSIENLKKLRNVQMVVLSLGGNDLYLHPQIQRKLFQSILPGNGHLAQQEGDEFGVRYRDLYRKIKLAAPDATVIPIIPYHPHYDASLLQATGLLGWASKKLQYLFLPRMVKPIIQEILWTAVQHSACVIDLSKTFDPKNEKHYGTGTKTLSTSLAAWSGVEPSCLSSQFIADLIVDALSRKKSPPMLLYISDKVFLSDKLDTQFIESYNFGP